MGVTSSNKQIDVDRIDCEGTLKVTLALSDVYKRQAQLSLLIKLLGQQR